MLVPLTGSGLCLNSFPAVYCFMWLIYPLETLLSEICLTTDVSYVITQRCILIKFDEHGNLLTWIRPETLMPTEFGSLSASEIMSKTEVIIDAELPSLWVNTFYRDRTLELTHALILREHTKNDSVKTFYPAETLLTSSQETTLMPHTVRYSTQWFILNT